MRTSRSLDFRCRGRGLPPATCSVAVTVVQRSATSLKPTSLHMIPIAGQRIDDCDLLHREVRHNLDVALVHDQHFLDAHAVAVALAVLRLERECHALLDLDWVVERPDA